MQAMNTNPDIMTSPGSCKNLKNGKAQKKAGKMGAQAECLLPGMGFLQTLNERLSIPGTGKIPGKETSTKEGRRTDRSLPETGKNGSTVSIAGNALLVNGMTGGMTRGMTGGMATGMPALAGNHRVKGSAGEDTQGLKTILSGRVSGEPDRLAALRVPAGTGGEGATETVQSGKDKVLSVAEKKWSGLSGFEPAARDAKIGKPGVFAGMFSKEQAIPDVKTGDKAAGKLDGKDGKTVPLFETSATVESSRRDHQGNAKTAAGSAAVDEKTGPAKGLKAETGNSDSSILYVSLKHTKEGKSGGEASVFKTGEFHPADSAKGGKPAAPAVSTAAGPAGGDPQADPTGNSPGRFAGTGKDSGGDPNAALNGGLKFSEGLREKVSFRDQFQAANGTNGAAEGTGSLSAAHEAAGARNASFQTGKASPAEALNPQNVLDRVAEGNEILLRTGSNRVRLTLSPPQFGTLDLDLHLGRDRVKLVLTADNGEVRQILQSNLDQLKSSLQGQGLNIERLDVLVQERADNGSGMMNQGNAPFSGGQSGEGRGEGKGEEETVVLSSGFQAGLPPDLQGRDGINVFA